MSQPPTANLLKIVWVDAVGGDGGWRSVDKETEMGLAEVVTVGWLMDEDDERLLMVSTMDDKGSCQDFCHIPKVLVKSRTVLKEVD